MGDKLISGTTAARLLGVSRQTITRWVRLKRLPGFVEGRVTRVWSSAVQAKLGRALAEEDCVVAAEPAA